MPAEFKDLITVISFLIAGYALFRNLKGDAKGDQAARTTVIVKLETINDNIKDLKNEMKDLKSDIEAIKERVTIVEQSTKSAHKRIDGLKNEHSEAE